MDMQQGEMLLQAEDGEVQRLNEDDEEEEGEESCTGQIEPDDSSMAQQGEFTLRSRRRQRPKQIMDTCLEEENARSSEISPVAISPPAVSTARFQVPDTTSSSLLSDAPSEWEGLQWQIEAESDDDDVDNASNSTNNVTIRLNQVCEAACEDILMDWENSLTNNNVEPKTLSHTPITPSGKGDEKDETDPMKLASREHAAGRFQFLRNNNVLLHPLSYYANLAKDLLEVFVFTVILLSFVYGIWFISKLWYVRTTRNSQDAIYPVLRTMRITSLAFLLNYPNAQELYEEACILQNPFYEMNDVSCWPCENVRHMLDFTGFSNFTSGYYQSGIPFIVKDALSKGVHFEDVYNLLKEDPISNLTSAAHLLSNHPEIETFDQLNEWTRRRDLNHQLLLDRKIHVTWKLNRAQYARMMRTLFHRPYYIPQETEISVQHFLFIDEPDGESYRLPITEFANVFLMQGDGPRLVVLMPVRHCQNVCKPIRVLLEPRDVLYYNWLFWRPIISPVKTAGITNHTLSITYVGSFY